MVTYPVYGKEQMQNSHSLRCLRGKRCSTYCSHCFFLSIWSQGRSQNRQQQHILLTQLSILKRKMGKTITKWDWAKRGISEKGRMDKGDPWREELGGRRDQEDPKGRSLVEKMGRSNSQEGIHAWRNEEVLSWNWIWLRTLSQKWSSGEHWVLRNISDTDTLLSGWHPLSSFNHYSDSELWRLWFFSAQKEKLRFREISMSPKTSPRWCEGLGFQPGCADSRGSSGC